jgi:hypothetical protein
MENVNENYGKNMIVGDTIRWISFIQNQQKSLDIDDAGESDEIRQMIRPTLRQSFHSFQSSDVCVCTPPKYPRRRINSIDMYDMACEQSIQTNDSSTLSNQSIITSTMDDHATIEPVAVSPIRKAPERNSIRLSASHPLVSNSLIGMEIIICRDDSATKR